MHRTGAYTFLMNDEDKTMFKWLQVFISNILHIYKQFFKCGFVITPYMYI